MPDTGCMGYGSLQYAALMPHVIEFFVADHCPGCPDARRRLQEFAARERDILIVERKVDDAMDEAHRYGLFATPAIVIDGREVLYGVPTLAQLAGRCGRLADVSAPR